MATVDDWLAQLGFAEPANPLTQPPTAPPFAGSPQVDPATLEALGLPSPTARGAEMAGSAPDLGGTSGAGSAGPVSGPSPSPDLMAALGAAPAGGGAAGAVGGGLQPSVGATENETAPALFGYNPQPRPALPGAIGTPPEEEGASDPFGQFRENWGGAEEVTSPQDLLSSLSAGPSTLPGMPGETPPSRALTPPWMGGGSGGGSYGPGQTSDPAHQVMRDRFPAALQRLNWLREMRTRRGY